MTQEPMVPEDLEDLSTREARDGVSQGQSRTVRPNGGLYRSRTHQTPKLTVRLGSLPAKSLGRETDAHLCFRVPDRPK